MPFVSASHASAFRYHHIFLKSILDFHQLGRNRAGSAQALAGSVRHLRDMQSVAGPGQSRVAHIADGSDIGVRAAAAEAASNANLANPWSAPSGAEGTIGNSSHVLTLSAENLSRVIGQQDAADRLRAAAEWVDARADTPCSDDLPMVASAAAGRRESFADDDLPLVQPPPHMLQPVLPPRMDGRPAAAHVMQVRPLPNYVVNVKHRPRWDADGRRYVDSPSIGSKRPASNSMGSSASNAIVIDDD